ncbi:MAG TPA: right-handed parallel beta-helix repeat-containing protein [Lysobacter sp.]
MLHTLPAIAMAVLLATASLPTLAAESYDNCKGFIDAVPATITTPGTWCLRKDLSTAMTFGAAITVATNNVTLDCNDFKIGGLAAGVGTGAYAIHANSRLNATVRHCNIRGFWRGLVFSGNGAGHVVEDNRFDGNTYNGLYVIGDGSVVRRNQVTDTGGSTAALGSAYGIITYLAVDVLDNTVSGVSPTADQTGDADAYGIYTESNPNGSISGNRVRGLVGAGGVAFGICNISNGRISLDGNHVVGPGLWGLVCSGSSSASAKDNIISGFTTPIGNCTDSGGNAVIP